MISISTPYTLNLETLNQVRAAQKQLDQIHIWKEGSGGDARVRFMRLLFSDDSDLEAGARASTSQKP
jgi:hypothetical protein